MNKKLKNLRFVYENKESIVKLLFHYFSSQTLSLEIRLRKLTEEYE
jgi:hypothetical protein